MPPRYENRNLADLRKLAKQRQIDGYYRMKKKKLISSLRRKKNKSKVRIKLKRKGSLSRHGYSSRKSAINRRQALRKAVHAEGALPIFRKLNVLAIFNKNRNPTLTKLFLRDRNWVKRNYMSNKSIKGRHY